MSEADGELTVAQRLGRLLDRGLLPAGGPAEAAERLIERLERQARVALLGLPGSGKSAILNLLAGTVVVPETLRLPTITVQHGTEARMLCTLADGRVEIVPGGDLSHILRLAPAMVTLELDIPALKVITLLEVSAGPMEAEQRRAAAWASKRADIIIWCTTSYLPKEQVVWEDMPDVVKDNGFLFLTKVDLLGSKEAAQGMLERVETRAGEEFRQVLAISAKQARQAMQAPGGLDRDLFRDSGAGAVITAIKSRVQMAQRADTDMAELLLARHVEASDLVARRFAETGDSKPPEWVPPPEAVEPQVQETAPPLASAPLSTPQPAREDDSILRAVAAASDEPPAEVEPEPEPQPEPVQEPEPLPEPEPEPEPVPEPAPQPVSEAPAVPTEPEAAPAPEPVIAEGRRRFADRMKQAPSDGPAAPQVPLRSTWKSKAEVATARQAPKAEPEPEAVPDLPSDAPTADRADIESVPGGAKPAEPAAPEAPEETEVAPVATAAEPEPVAPPAAPPPESDDERIARMIAAAAANVQRQPRERQPRSERREAAPVAPEPAPDGGDLRARLFGARRTAAATDVKQPDAKADLPPVEPAETETAEPAAIEPMLPEPEPERERAAAIRIPSAAERLSRTSRTVERVARDRSPAPPITNVPIAAMSARPEAAAATRDLRVERRERPRIAARAVAVAPVAAPAAPVPVPEAERALLDEAIDLIVSRSGAIADRIDPDAKVPVDLVLEYGRETTEALQGILSRGISPGVRRINTNLGEVVDLILLMQLEKGHAPADDALTLLLQLRREMETLRQA